MYTLRTGDVVVSAGVGGTVTSVAQTFTGGLISVAGSPVTTTGTLALTVAGTSGGIPYFSGATTWASSAALTANAIVLGGGAGSAPAVLASLGTTTTVLHGNAAGAPTFGAVSLTADVSGTLPIGNGGTGITVPSGTYTPSLTNVTNISASTAYACQWMRINDMVLVSGAVDVDPTAAADTRLGISLPVASNFGTFTNLGGTSTDPVGQAAIMYADSANDYAVMQWTANNLTNHTRTFIFSYQVI